MASTSATPLLVPIAEDKAEGFSLDRFLPQSIAAKLSLISIVAIVVMLIFGSLLIFTQSSLTRSLATTINLQQETERANSLLRDIRQTGTDLDAVIDNDETELIGLVLAQNESLLADFSTYRSVAEELNLTADINFTIENEPLFSAIRRDIFASLTLYRDGDIQTAQEIRDAVDRNIAVLANGLDRSASQRSFLLTEELEQATNLQTQSAIIIFSVLAVGTIILVAITFFVARSISNNLKKLQEAADKFEAGNYAERASINTRDEIADLAQSFNLMAQTVQNREASLVESRKEADENSRLKSEFLSTMSHELRTPMNAIEGFTGIMLERMGGVEFNDKTEDYLTKIEWNSRRLLGLINDFLDLSRIESGRLELVYLPISLSEMAQRWHDNFGVLAENKDLGFEVIVDSNLPETFYADQESLSKIAINLLGNAAKFTEAGTIALRLEKRNDMVALEVSDTGIGIPPHARDFIFDEFRQVDQSSTREHGGTGLGLSIVQKLVRAMNGQISLESEVGVGSTFTVLLPIRKEGQVVVGVAS